MVGIFDDTDNKFDVVDGKHIGAQLSYSGDVGDIYLNYLGGTNGEDSTSFNQIDLTASLPLTEAFNLGVNATAKPSKNEKYGESDGSWFGAALYLSYQAKED